MGSDHALQNVSAFEEGRLVTGNKPLENPSQPVGEDLSKNFETTVKQADGSKLLHGSSIRFLRDEGEHGKVESRYVQLSLMKIIKHGY